MDQRIPPALAPDALRQEFAADRLLAGIRLSTVLRGLEELVRMETDTDRPPHLLERGEYKLWLGRYDANSAHFRLRITRVWFRWLVAEGHRADDPTHRVSIKVEERPMPTATDHDVESMLRLSLNDTQAHAALRLLVATGARRSEIGLMTVGDVRGHLHDGVVRIRHSKTRPRLAVVDAQTREAVERDRRSSEYLATARATYSGL